MFEIICGYIEVYGTIGVIIALIAVVSIGLLIYIVIPVDTKINLKIIELRKYPISYRFFKVISVVILITQISLCIFFILCYSPPSKISECKYYVNELDGTLISMIVAEAEAVNKKDVSIIKNIFKSDAKIEDVKNNKSWNDPVAHYEKMFGELSFSEAINYSITKISDDGTKIIFRSASRGNYNGNIYSNPPGSNEWTFGRGPEGCWKIKSFRYNIPQ